MTEATATAPVSDVPTEEEDTRGHYAIVELEPREGDRSVLRGGDVLKVLEVDVRAGGSAQALNDWLDVPNAPEEGSFAAVSQRAVKVRTFKTIKKRVDALGG